MAERKPQVIDPLTIDILNLLDGKSYKEARSILLEARGYLEKLAKLTVISTEALTSELQKFNQNGG